MRWDAWWWWMTHDACVSDCIAYVVGGKGNGESKSWGSSRGKIGKRGRSRNGVTCGKGSRKSREGDSKAWFSFSSPTKWRSSCNCNWLSSTLINLILLLGTTSWLQIMQNAHALHDNRSDHAPNYSCLLGSSYISTLLFLIIFFRININII